MYGIKRLRIEDTHKHKLLVATNGAKEKTDELIGTKPTKIKNIDNMNIILHLLLLLVKGKNINSLIIIKGDRSKLNNI